MKTRLVRFAHGLLLTLVSTSAENFAAEELARRTARKPQRDWSPTAGKRPMPTFRFYGPTEALNKKTFKMPEFKLAN
jgi:hypothetical protein